MSSQPIILQLGKNQSITIPVKVRSVNGQVGDVVLDAADVGAVALENVGDGKLMNYVTLTYDGDNVTMTKSFVNVNNGSEYELSETVLLANDTTAGLMSPADVVTLELHTNQIAALQGQTVRLLYTDSTTPTEPEIAQFVTDSGYTTDLQNIAVVVSETFHIWHWYSNTETWQDDGVDTVSQFTNSTPGTIKGAAVAGKIYAESDGTGSVYGWDGLMTDIENAVTDAENAADDAQDDADAAAASSTLAESWAVGGTGTRAGEDTNNAKYYADEAATSEQNASDYADAAASSAASVGALNYQVFGNSFLASSNGSNDLSPDYLIQYGIGSTGQYVAATTRLSTNMIPVQNGMTVTVALGTNVKRYWTVKYKADGTFIEKSAVIQTDGTVSIDYNGYFALSFAKDNYNLDITVAEYDAKVAILGNENGMVYASPNTNVNTLTRDGNYILSVNGGYPNCPWTSGRRMIAVYRYGANYIYQIAANDNGEIAMRTWQSNTWRPWAINNVLMQSNFVPVKSRRLMFTKGKIWEYNWNTAEAFMASGQAADCWGISADVRKTSDGYYVCFHDSTVDAQTDGSGAIESMTWAQVQALNVDCATWDGSQWIPQPDGQTCKIPLLTDFLDICKRYGKVAIVETKIAGSNSVATMANADYNAITQFVIDRGMVGGFAWMTTTDGATYLRNTYPQVFKIITKESAFTDDFINTWTEDPNLLIAAHNSRITADVVAKIHAKNHFIAAYTPRTQPQTEYETMAAKNVDLIFTYREPPADFND